ncbi:hypothetical protein [Bradyrhizobium sp.]
MTADEAGSVDQRTGKFNSTISANRAANVPGMTENLDFCPCHAVPNQGIQYPQ